MENNVSIANVKNHRTHMQVFFKIYLDGVVSGAPGLPGGSGAKNPPANTGDARDSGLIPRSGRSPGGGNGKPLQHSCLGNPMDRGAQQATVHRVSKSWTQLSS